MAKYDLVFEPPVMNAAGFLGFAPGRNFGCQLPECCCFITNPVSLRPRHPSRGERLARYPGGILLHSGYPNPGFSRILSRYTSSWQRSAIPIVVHLLANAPDELSTMITRLEGVEAVAGIEVGFQDWAEKSLIEECLEGLSSELPVIARMPLSRVLEFAHWLDDPVRLTAISIGPARGALRRESGRFLEGRLYGPSLFPQILHTVKVLSSLRVPLIAGGGVYREEQLGALLETGAAAVQLDSVLWKGGFMQTASS